ncbi:MAG: hypothetical protein JO149_02835, partial [Gammaproteobacteria bacterium]|nr:hypothetical protein [Gammaproteobacteria bacterium]
MNTSIKKNFMASLVEGSIDAKVNQDILKTHAKESIVFPSYGNLSITNINPNIISRAEFTECEISPFRKHELTCETNETPIFKRKSSQFSFNARTIDLAIIKNLLIHAFSPSEEGHRPYPSAGGLYPIEPLVFIFNERLENPEAIFSGCYHFRPISKSLQLIKKISLTYFCENLLHHFIEINHAPNFAILYIAHLGKTIFKY